jgi:8-oxo-dGTP diphosphatase
VSDRAELPSIHVVAGALFDTAGQVLIAQRPPGKHMAGGWEFPGGKREPGESTYDALKRELKEELGVDVHSATPVIEYWHTYPTRRILLDLWRVTEFTGTPASLEGQPLRWCPLEDLKAVGLLEADWPMIAALKKIVTPA